MDFLNTLKEGIPDYAKDIRLNLDATIGRSSLDPADALGAALTTGARGDLPLRRIDDGQSRNPPRPMDRVLQ